jgi:signal transduction histidine kinase
MRERLERGRPPWTRAAFDGLLAVGLAALSVSLVHDVLGQLGGQARPPAAVAYALALAHTLPVALRRRFPRAVLATAIATGVLAGVLGLPTIVLGPAVLVPVYTVAVYCDRWSALAGLAGVELAVALDQLAFASTGVDTWVGNSLVLAAAWVLGRFVGDRRVHTMELEARTLELELAREELARQAVTEERLRIARELHDVVAHSMSVIAVQSGVGAHVLDTRPEEARKALETIEGVSRGALDELRRLLGVLRDDDEAQGVSPMPGLGDLDALLARMGEAGLAVKLRVHGARPEVPQGVDVSAYRIVQEALTNVLKHAGAASAQVVVTYDDHAVAVEVTDGGHGAPAGQAWSGHGIGGMRERAALFGGDLEVGPRPGGGFRVAARLPFEAPAR